MGDMKFNLVDYQATKLDDQPVQLMKVRNDQTSEPITFTFFKGNSTLVVSDFDDLIFFWGSSQNTLKDIADYSKSIGYFTSKCVASGVPIYEYPKDKVEKDLSDWADECEIANLAWGEEDTLFEDWDDEHEFLKSLTRCYDYYSGLQSIVLDDGAFWTHTVREALDAIDPDWAEELEAAGRRPAATIEYVAQALQAGVELLSLSIKGKEEQKND